MFRINYKNCTRSSCIPRLSVFLCKWRTAYLNYLFLSQNFRTLSVILPAMSFDCLLLYSSSKAARVRELSPGEWEVTVVISPPGLIARTVTLCFVTVLVSLYFWSSCLLTTRCSNRRWAGSSVFLSLASKEGTPLNLERSLFWNLRSQRIQDVTRVPIQCVVVRVEHGFHKQHVKLRVLLPFLPG